MPERGAAPSTDRERPESSVRAWRRIAVGAVAIAACGKPAPESRKPMPILTPAQDKQLRAFAPDCQPPYSENDGDVMITCIGGANVQLTEMLRGGRLRSLEIELSGTNHEAARSTVTAMLGDIASPEVLAMIDRHLDDRLARDSDGTELEPSGYQVDGLGIRSYAFGGDMPGYGVEVIWPHDP